METIDLLSLRKQFAYYKLLGDRTMAQLSDEQLLWQYNDDNNSIGVIVKHLWGNMLSRWTDFLTSDGEKTWRERDAEFEADIKTRTELMEKWEAGWSCLFSAIDSLTVDDLDKEIFIRNQGHSVIEALFCQLSHYSYHVGQMVYIGKMLCDKEWQSLSIPKGESKAYNAQKFSEEKFKQHFTDEFLKKK